MSINITRIPIVLYQLTISKGELQSPENIHLN